MKLTIIALLLIFPIIYSFLQPKDALFTALTAILQENKIDRSASGMVQCIDDDSAVKIVNFISSSLRKGEKGSPGDIISLIDDLHSFYRSLPSPLKQCLDSNEELFLISYKYGIGYLPLAEQQFKRYTQVNFLKLHKKFGQISDSWNNKAEYQVAAFNFASFGHELYPVIKKTIRGVWLTNVASSALDSLSNLQKAVEQCYRAHINTIFVVVYNNARTIYPSHVMEQLIGVKQQQKYAGRDPLQQLIQISKKYNIEVHAWFQYGFSSSYSAEGGPIIQKKPTWKALDSDGNLVVKNGFDWLNGFDPEVQNFMISLFEQVLTNYEVDGVQGDDRLPALPSIAGYESYTINLYKQEHGGKIPPTDHTDSAWVQWRVDKLNSFMKRLYLSVKQIKPEIYLSIAPSPYPWSVNEYLQDWPTWVKFNWVDAVIPQCYRYNFSAYQSVLKQQLSYYVNEKTVFATGILLNIGDYTANTTFLSEMVSENRQLGLDGESFFFYEGICRQSDWFEHTYSKKMQVMQS